MSAQTPKEVWGHVPTIQGLSMAEQEMLNLDTEFGADLHRQGYLQYRYPEWQLGQRWRLTEKGVAYLAELRKEYLAKLPLRYGILTGWVLIVSRGNPWEKRIPFVDPQIGFKVEAGEDVLDIPLMSNLQFATQVMSEAGLEVTEPVYCWSQEVCVHVGHRMVKCPCPHCRKEMSPWRPIEKIPEWGGYRFVCETCRKEEDNHRLYVQDYQARMNGEDEVGL